MKTVGVTDLKARLSEYLRAVKAGEEVQISERGRPVARLLPVADAVGDEHLISLERAGVVRRGTGKLPEGFLKKELPGDPDASVRRALIEERRSSR